MSSLFNFFCSPSGTLITRATCCSQSLGFARVFRVISHDVFWGHTFDPTGFAKLRACDYIYACARDPLVLPSLFTIEWPWFEEKCFCQLKSVMWLGSILFIISDRLNLSNPAL